MAVVARRHDDSAASALAAFEALAPVYDIYTAADDYERWGDLLASLLEAGRPPGRRLLDVGCGTGRSTAVMASRGYDVTGCDLSPAMLAQARGKLPGTPLHEADMRDLSTVPGTPYDVVQCIDDAVNFLLTDDDLLAAFTSAASVLAPGGLYVFDCNTLHTYRTWYADSTVTEGPGVVCAWDGEARSDHRPGQVARAGLAVYTLADDGRWVRSDSPHTQRHHPVATVQRLLRRAGFVPLAAHGLARGRMRPSHDEDTDVKIIHVARRATEHPRG